MVVQGFFLGLPTGQSGVDRGPTGFSFRSLVSSIRGVEYGALLVGVRISLLNALSVHPEGAMMVKFVTLLYEPIASVFGLLLRFFNAQAGFVPHQYTTLSALFFIGQSAILGSTLVVLLRFGGTWLAAVLIVLLLLFAVSLTTHFIYAGRRTKRRVLLLLFASFGSCITLGIQASLATTSVLMVMAFFLMHNDLKCNSEGGAS